MRLTPLWVSFTIFAVYPGCAVPASGPTIDAFSGVGEVGPIEPFTMDAPMKLADARHGLPEVSFDAGFIDSDADSADSLFDAAGVGDVVPVFPNPSGVHPPGACRPLGSGQFMSLALSKAADLMAIGTRGGYLYVVRTSDRETVLSQFIGETMVVGISGAGNRIAVGVANGAVTVIDVLTGHEIRTFTPSQGRYGSITGIALSSDGNYVAWTEQNYSVKEVKVFVRSVESGESLAFGDPVHSAAENTAPTFSRDGRYLALNCTVLSLPDGAYILQDTRGTTADFSSDGTVFSCGRREGFDLYNLADGTLSGSWRAATQQTNPPVGGAFFASSTQILRWGDSVELIDIATGTTEKTLFYEPKRVAAYGDGMFVAFGQLGNNPVVEDNNPILIRTTDGAILARGEQIGHQWVVDLLGYTADSKTVITYDLEKLVYWNVEDGTIKKTVTLRPDTLGVGSREAALSIPQDRLVEITRDGLHLRKASDGTLILKRPYEAASTERDILFSSTGRYFVTHSKSLDLWRSGDGSAIYSIPEVAYTSDFSLDEKWLAMAGPLGLVGTIRVFATEGGELKFSAAWPEAETRIYGIAFSPDASLVAAFSGRTVRLLRTSDGSHVRDFPMDGFQRIHWLADGTAFMAIGQDSAKLFRVSDGAILRTVAKGTSSWFLGDVTADGSVIAMAESRGGGTRNFLWLFGTSDEMRHGPVPFAPDPLRSATRLRLAPSGRHVTISSFKLLHTGCVPWL
jgi:WD40 repeat protein